MQHCKLNIIPIKIHILTTCRILQSDPNDKKFSIQAEGFPVICGLSIKKNYIHSDPKFANNFRLGTPKFYFNVVVSIQNVPKS